MGAKTYKNTMQQESMWGKHVPLRYQTQQLLEKRFRAMSVDKQIAFVDKFGICPIKGEYMSKWGLPKGNNPTTITKGYMRLEIDGKIMRTARFNDRPTKNRLFSKWNMDVEQLKKYRTVAILIVHDY